MILQIYILIILFILCYFIIIYKNNKDNNSDIKIIKKIANGWSGVVYKCKINNIYAIYKIEKLYIDKYNRQIDFSINFGNKYPDKFLRLIRNGIVNNCKYKSILKNNIPSFFNKIKIK